MSKKVINWFEEMNKNQFDEATQLKSNFQSNQILIKIKIKSNLKKNGERERERERESWNLMSYIKRAESLKLRLRLF